MKVNIRYKLFRLRKDGSIGPLFINTKQRIPVGEWLQSESHLTKGFAYRPGWHATTKPYAPHLSEKGRVWCMIETEGEKVYNRPESQGGTWILADRILVVSILSKEEVENLRNYYLTT